MTIWLQWRILLLRSGMVIKQGKQRKKERVKKKKKIEQKNPTQQHVHKAWPIIDGRGVDLSCSDIPEKRNKNSAEQNASTASAETRTGNPLITSLKPWWFWNIPRWCRMLTRCHKILTRLFYNAHLIMPNAVPKLKNKQITDQTLQNDDRWGPKLLSICCKCYFHLIITLYVQR